jgi:rhamnose transport system ATP-binding protein
MPSPLLELRQITKSFGGARALRSVDFDLHAGEVHALLGENGAGKSTLIKIVTGAHQPDAGTLAVAGQPVSGLTPAAAHRLGIACIYQQPALFPDLTVEENIGLRLEPGTALRRIDWAARRARAQALLHPIGATLSPDTEVRHLSMPEQQLVEIACALGAGARIVIMDEPTASLTQPEQQLLFTIVRDLRRRGVGVIYISHRLEEIFALADRVTVLRDGASVGTRWVRPSPENTGASAGAGPAVPAITEAELIRMMVGREMAPAQASAAPPPGEVVLSVRGLGCAAAGVQGVTFDLRAGEVLGLAGLVGAGRTELARVLFGLTPADAGTLALHGEPVVVHSPTQAMAHGLAYVPEDRRRHGVVLELAVEENITLALHHRLFPGTWLRFAAERALALDFIRRLAIKCAGLTASVSSLSGGNQQKVSLARWLATKPKVLILDEPTQGVDVGAKAEIHRLIRQLTAEGLAVLLISSDLSEVIELSDRIGVMRSGTLAALLPGRADAHEVMAAALGQAKGAAA